LNHHIGSTIDLANIETIPCEERSKELDGVPRFSVQSDIAKTYDSFYPQQSQSTTSYSWLDSLVFSDEEDPFRADWPYWTHKSSPVASVAMAEAEFLTRPSF
jgi:hypothetical protein